MSHFTVMIALDKSVDMSRDEKGDYPGLRFALDNVLERFSEEREVEPYKEYMSESIDDFWWVKAVRRARQHVIDGTGIKPYEPGPFSYSSSASNQTEAEQLAELKERAEWATLLDNTVTHKGKLTWYDIINCYDSWKRQTGDLSAEVFYDEETGKPYTLETYNPQSKWDWWTIGGRWSGKFHAKSDVTVISDDIIPAQNTRGWNAPKRESWDGLIDGGRIKYVDLERCRDKEGATALKRHRAYHALVALRRPGRG